jgi:chemotaxis protein MotB
MAIKKKEEAPKGSPAWMSTFSDLMNLLLCFFVLLYSMSTVNEEKFQQVIASLQHSMSILPSGGSSIGEGEMISSGVRQLEFLDSYYNEMANSESEEETDDTTVVEAYLEQELSESEEMAEQIQQAVKNAGLQDLVEVDFNAEYVQLSLSGAVLFDSGSAEIPEDVYPIMDKISAILEQYDHNIIEIEGHTDNVPMSSQKYENNDVLSMYRALNFADYVREHTSLNPAYIKSSGRGAYVPVADNSTAEGRARNRRVEIKIYNSYNSDVE